MRRALIPALCVLAVTGCAARRAAEPSIPEQTLPASFEAGFDGPSIAETSWREWFADERLNALVTEALESNQDLKIALQRIDLARAGVRSATGALLPEIRLNVGAGVQKPGLYTEEGAGNATTDIAPGRPTPTHLPDFTLGLQSAWEVDLWGKLRSQRESALAQYLASIEGSRLVLTSLVTEVAVAYFDLLALDHVRDVLRQYVTRQQEALEVVRLQKAAGRANELAVQQFEAQLAETRALASDIAQQSVEAENRLHVLLGRYPKALVRNKDALLASVPTNVSAGVPAALLRNRPDVREAELQVRASRFDLKAARAAFFPNLTLSAGLGLHAFDPGFLFQVSQSLATSVVGELVAPLVNRSAIQAQFEGAQANQLQALYGYQKTVLVAYVEVVNSLSSIRNTDEVLSLKKAQKAALEQSVATADVLYRAGKASYLEVLVAQQSALESELDLIEAWRKRWVAQVNVYKALGGGGR